MEKGELKKRVGKGEGKGKGEKELCRTETIEGEREKGGC